MEDNTSSLTRSIGTAFGLFKKKQEPESPPAIELTERRSELVGISDVDHTLVFAAEDDYNEEEIAGLLEYNINHLWFASDMSFSESEMRIRLGLEVHLKRNKIKLLGIITTSDYAWHISTEILKRFYDACHNNQVNVDFKLKQDLDKLMLVLEREEFEPIRKLMTGDISGQVEPGTVYQLIKEKFGKDGKSYQYLKDRALHAKWVVDTICSLSAVPRTGLKGLISRPLFTNQRLAENRTFVFFDDKKDEVEDVNNEIKVLGVRASAFLSPLKKDPARTKEYYCSCINEHCLTFGVTKNPTPKGSLLSLRRANSNAGSSTPPRVSRSPASLSSPSSSEDLASIATGKPSLKARMTSNPK